MKPHVCLFLALLVSPTGLAADEIDDYVRAEMASRRIPGVAIVLMDKGQIVKSATYGIANLETNSPVTPQSVFDLASLTKPFTAAAVMMLVEDGKIDLNESVRKYVTGLPAAWESMTVAHLLSHTAGLPSLFPEEEEGPPMLEVSAASQFASLVKMQLRSAPGTRGEYSDPGYFLLGVVIEKVSGKRYGDFLAERIFRPLAMNSTELIDHWKIVRNRVSDYILPRNELLNARRDYQVELPSYFGLRSTIDDLANWERALYEATALKRDTLKRMWTPAKLTDGRENSVGGRPYGFGWMLGDFDGHPLAEHSGFTGTDMLRLLDNGKTVIVLTNLGVVRSRPESLARGIMERVGH
jgi:CubicO group peptidase (beta-lactamase class C family)